jgi:hypothetical protein
MTVQNDADELALADAISDLALGLKLDRLTQLGHYSDRDRDGRIVQTPYVKE